MSVYLKSNTAPDRCAAMQATYESSADGFLPIAPFQSLWRSRHLFWCLLVRDIVSTFRGSVLGLAWIVLIPLVMVAIYTFVFGRVLGTSWATPTRTPYEVPLIFFLGLSVFGFYIEVITRAPRHLRENGTYVTKVIFPLEILGWVLVGSALFKMAVNFTLLFAFMAIMTGGVPREALLLPLLLVPFVLLVTGIGWAMAATGTFVRDLSHALQAVGPIIMFVSPVFYSLAQVPQPLRPVYYANPMTFILESARSLLFFDGNLSWAGLLVYWLAAIAVFIVGYAYFQRLRPGFADVI